MGLQKLLGDNAGYKLANLLEYLQIIKLPNEYWGTGLPGVAASLAMRKSEGFKSLVFHQHGWVPELDKRGGL